VWKRIRYGEKFAAFSALALFGAMFLVWFGGHGGPLQGVDATGSSSRVRLYLIVDMSGWDSLATAAVVIVVLAIVAGLALPFVYAYHDSPVLPILSGIVACGLGILTVLALLAEAIWQPGPDQFVDIRSGWWIGLLAAIGIARGGYLSMHDEYMPSVLLTDVEVRPAPPSIEPA
jgi:hypothetical protein